MIKVTAQDQIVIISLDRPDKRNAMTPEMLEELEIAFKTHAEHARAMVLIGEGSVFCAGFDLKACADDPGGETMRRLLTGLSRIVRTMRAVEIPIVLGVHGAAIAGGCALLGGADIVVADESAKLGYPVVRIGVSPAVSAAFMLALIPSGSVRTQLLDTELISGTDAKRIDLVHETVEEPQAARDRAIEIAHQLAAKPGIACASTKSWLNALAEPITDHARQGLDVSLSLTGTQEEQDRLSELWK